MMKKNLSLIAACSIFFLPLLGCGGGGSNSDNEIPTPSARIVITQANSEDVSGEAFAASGSASTASSGPLVFSVSLEAEQSDFEITDFVKYILTRLPENTLATDTLVQAISVGPETINCVDLGGVSGQMTISGNVASLSIDSPGDEINLTLFNCEIQPGLIGDGGMDFVINALSGDPNLVTPPYEFGANITFDNFRISDGLGNYFADGDMTIYQNASVGNTATNSISSSYLTVKEGASTQQRLFDYLVESTFDLNIFTYTSEISGLVESALLGGSVRFTTTTTLEGSLFDIYPNSGTLLLTGANNSAARVVIVDNNSVNLWVDADGDGIFDGPTNVLWDDLFL